MAQDKIAVSKYQRAGKLVKAGAKVGTNYMKHYAKKLAGAEASKSNLQEANAKDIYTAFSELKGGPLKVAQMLSMGDQVLPKAYVDQFAMAQNQVPPLSLPLVRKTFRKAFDLDPMNLFDEFSPEAVNAASIGQVHKAKLGKREYAIKVQYPGVADSLQSDLRMVAPIAIRFLGMKKNEIAPYLKEVDNKLLEETDYRQELANAREIISGCQDLEGLVFPEFEAKYSNDRVLTMTWVQGDAFTDWLATNPSQEERNKIGQWMWNFFQYQTHELRVVHADPHPGNFIITPDKKLGVIDFGCVKHIPDDFYHSYEKLMRNGHDLGSPKLSEALFDLELLYKDDSKKERKLVMEVFGSLFQLVGRPFYTDRFDFGKDTFLKEVYDQGMAFSKDSTMRRLSARGSRHFIYFNRAYFGLYQLLNQLKAQVNTGMWTFNDQESAQAV